MVEGIGVEQSKGSAESGRQSQVPYHMMWKVTLALNTMLMLIFGYASQVSQVKLHNALRFPDKLGDLPVASLTALRIWWLYWAIPLLWVVLGVIVAVRNWRKPDPPRDTIELHTSATLFVGLLMLLFFVAAGIMPFVLLY